MNLNNRLEQLEKTARCRGLTGDGLAEMEADPRFWPAVWGMEREAFAAKWPEFRELFVDRPDQEDPIEMAILAVGQSE
jgi:hypothetical protein